MTKQKKPQKKKTFAETRIEYALAGGAIGAYFGAFYTPLREVNLLLPFIFSLVIVVATLGLNYFYQKERHPAGDWLKKALVLYVKYVIFLMFLQLRRPVIEAGGRTGVVLFMTIGGVIAGIQTAYEQRK